MSKLPKCQINVKVEIEKFDFLTFGFYLAFEL